MFLGLRALKHVPRFGGPVDPSSYRFTDPNRWAAARRPQRSLTISLGEALAARALYLDALGSLFDGCSLHAHLQHTILEAGVDLTLVGALRQRHPPAEGTVAAFPDVVATTLLFLIDFVLAGDRQD